MFRRLVGPWDAPDPSSPERLRTLAREITSHWREHPPLLTNICFAAELERAYCRTQTGRTRVAMRVFSVLSVLPWVFFAGQTCAPRNRDNCGNAKVAAMLPDPGLWQELGAGAIMCFGVVNFMTGMVRRLPLAVYECVFTAVLAMTACFAPLTHRWRAAAVNRVMSGEANVRPDTCLNEWCDKMSTDTVLLLCLAVIQLVSAVLPRARCSWVVMASANLSYILLSFPFGGAPEEGRGDYGFQVGFLQRPLSNGTLLQLERQPTTVAITVAHSLMLMLVGLIAWLTHAATEMSLRRGFLHMLTMAALHAEREESERQFAATAYHELRNPLNGTVGYLRVMHQLLSTAADEQQRQGSRAPDCQKGHFLAPSCPALAASTVTTTTATETGAGPAKPAETDDDGDGDGDGDGDEPEPPLGAALLSHTSDALVCCEAALVNLRCITRLYKAEAGGDTKKNLLADPHPVTLDALLANAAVLARPLLSAGVVLHLEHPTSAEWEAAGLPGSGVLLDGTALSQILANLLQNATRFTTAGCIALTCRLRSPAPLQQACAEAPGGGAGGVGGAGALGGGAGGGTGGGAGGVGGAPGRAAVGGGGCCDVEFEVLDSGCSIAPEMQEQLARGDRYASIGGIGLGMVLCRMLVHSLVSTLGGSEIELISPAPPERLAEAFAARRRPPSGSSPDVLSHATEALPGGTSRLVRCSRESLASGGGVDASAPGLGTCIRFVLTLRSAAEAVPAAGAEAVRAAPLRSAEGCVADSSTRMHAHPDDHPNEATDEASPLAEPMVPALDTCGAPAAEAAARTAASAEWPTQRPTAVPSAPDAAVPYASPSTTPAGVLAALPRGIRVLIADDVKSNRDLLQLVFKKMLKTGWRVAEAETGESMLQLMGVQPPPSSPSALEEGLRAAGHLEAASVDGTVARRHWTDFDLVITDENFSPDPAGLKGSDCVRLLRAAGCTLPIILCSGNVDGDGADGAAPGQLSERDAVFVDAGADACWGKPIPSWTDGSMQTQLAALFRKRPPAADAAKSFV